MFERLPLTLVGGTDVATTSQVLADKELTFGMAEARFSFVLCDV